MRTSKVHVYVYPSWLKCKDSRDFHTWRLSSLLPRNLPHPVCAYVLSVWEYGIIIWPLHMYSAFFVQRWCKDLPYVIHFHYCPRAFILSMHVLKVQFGPCEHTPILTIDAGLIQGFPECHLSSLLSARFILCSLFSRFNCIMYPYLYTCTFLDQSC